jgi:hypothetical protein
LGGLLKTLAIDPGSVLLGPSGDLLRIMSAVSKKKAADLLFDVALVTLQILPKSGQIPHGFLLRSGNPYGGQLSGPVESGQRLGVPPIRFDPVPSLLGNQGRCDNHAGVSGLQKLPVHGVSTGSGLVNKGHFGPIFGEPLGQLYDSIKGVGKSPIKPNLTIPCIGNGHGD